MLFGFSGLLIAALIARTLTKSVIGRRVATAVAVIAAIGLALTLGMFILIGLNPG